MCSRLQGKRGNDSNKNKRGDTKKLLAPAGYAGKASHSSQGEESPSGATHGGGEASIEKNIVGLASLEGNRRSKVLIVQLRW